MPRKKAEEELDRQRVAYTLHLAGVSWPDIAKHEYSDGSKLYSDWRCAHSAVENFVKSGAFDATDAEYRITDIARYEALHRAMWRKALSGDVAAGKLVLEIMKSKERLLGIVGMEPPKPVNDPMDELAQRRNRA